MIAAGSGTPPGNATEQVVPMTGEWLEAGDVYFFHYRPRVGDGPVDFLDGVQRLQIVLHPWAGQALRLLVLSRRRLSDATAAERAWCFVDRVTRRPEDLDEALGERTYRTRTRGVRVQPPARPAGEGAYVIARHGDHTHLAFEMAVPRRPGAQRDLGLGAEIGYIVAVRNPTLPPPPGDGRPGPRPAAPGAPPEHFDGRRFIPLDPPGLLDHQGTQLVLVDVGAAGARELDLHLADDAETAVQQTLIDDLRVGRRRLAVAAGQRVVS